MSFSASTIAQELDPEKGVRATGVDGSGRIFIENADTSFSCALEPRDGEVILGDCRQIEASAAPIGLANLSVEEWESQIRSALLDADCKLSTFRVVGDAIAAMATDKGASAAEVEDLRAAMSVRAEEAIDRMLREGTVTVRDGELALDSCK